MLIGIPLEEGECLQDKEQNQKQEDIKENAVESVREIQKIGNLLQRFTYSSNSNETAPNFTIPLNYIENIKTFVTTTDVPPLEMFKALWKRPILCSSGFLLLFFALGKN